MNAHISPLPAILPSRQAVHDRAITTLGIGGPVFITGAPGSGKTTLGQRIIADRAAQGRFVHRLSGSQALSTVPFGALAAVSAQVPGLISPGLAPTEAVATLAHKGLAVPRTLLIEQANFVDEASAAALVQLWPTVELVITGPSISSLPTDMQQLAFQREACHAELTLIDSDDARVLLEDLLEAPCNASAVNRLVNISGGNPLYLRELAIQAEQQHALTLVNGFLTLTHDWAPIGGRISDLIALRLRGQSEALRDAVYRIALTGPIPTTLASALIDEAVLEQGEHEGLLVTSHRHHLTDIAQSFDGPGAESALNHPEEMVQLGAGLSFELVRRALDTTSLRTNMAYIHEHIDESALSESARMHLSAAREPEGQGDAAEHTDGAPDRTLAALAEHMIELVHRGRPLDGVRVFAEHVGTPLWHASSSQDQTVFIQCMYLAMLGEGSRPDTFDEHFTSINWHEVALDHVVFLTGRGDMFLEMGNATEAKELLAQALGVSQAHDATGIAGFTSGLHSVTSTMLGDLDVARQHYSAHLGAPPTSGGPARPEADRLTLLTVLHLEGKARAHEQYEALLAQATASGHTFLAMRLLHDAWRLRLIEDHEHLAHLDRLANVAHQVQGSFAALLTQYAPAFRALTEGEHGGSAPAASHTVETSTFESHTVESIALAHLAAGRALFAAEVAARAAEIAQAAGNRKRAQSLMTIFAQATPLLAGVNTPSLGRARIDPVLLSEREVEVCIAATVGQTNPEIAAELFLSPRTVEGHLQRAYAKLGITDRRQLLPMNEASDSPS